MSNNGKSITDLRAVLFETLEGVKNGTLDLDKARSINEVAKTIVDTAKVEVEFLRVAGGEESTFIAPPPAPPADLPAGIVGITQHRIGR